MTKIEVFKPITSEEYDKYRRKSNITMHQKYRADDVELFEEISEQFDFNNCDMINLISNQI
jgi:hypothetical protein